MSASTVSAATTHQVLLVAPCRPPDHPRPRSFALPRRFANLDDDCCTRARRWLHRARAPRPVSVRRDLFRAAGCVAAMVVPLDRRGALNRARHRLLGGHRRKRLRHQRPGQVRRRARHGARARTVSPRRPSARDTRSGCPQRYTHGGGGVPRVLRSDQLDARRPAQHDALGSVHRPRGRAAHPL